MREKSQPLPGFFPLGKALGQVLLSNDIVGDFAVDVGESKIPAGVLVKSVSRDSNPKVKDGGMEVMEVHAVFHRSHAVLIGGSVNHTAFHSAAGHPKTKPGRVVISTVILPDVRCAAKFTAPDDERFFSSPRSFKSFSSAASGLSVAAQFRVRAALRFRC